MGGRHHNFKVYFLRSRDIRFQLYLNFLRNVFSESPCTKLRQNSGKSGNKFLTTLYCYVDRSGSTTISRSAWGRGSHQHQGFSFQIMIWFNIQKKGDCLIIYHWSRSFCEQNVNFPISIKQPSKKHTKIVRGGSKKTKTLYLGFWPKLGGNKPIKQFFNYRPPSPFYSYLLKKIALNIMNSC